MEVFNERPGGGARDANAPPAPEVQLRAMWPKRPQFWCFTRMRFIIYALARRSSRSTSVHRWPAASDWGTPPGCDRRHRKSSTAWKQPYVETGTQRTHGQAGGNCSRDAAPRYNFPQYDQLMNFSRVSNERLE